ncbi:glycosyltransferase [Synechococcus sp. GEYO]|uniref:glycosyltransferase n=1 Tax=Synechococcus sp. GEYO TaxID=2575511 RepID=UPI000E0FB698|nr:glycosyltransferase [Synechococcus sp. GEYO]
MSSTEPSLGGFNSIRVLVPGTGTRFRCGGLSVALQTARLLSKIRSTEVVTYQDRQVDHPFLDDLLQVAASEDRSLWLVSWGFHVPQLLRRLKGRFVVYQAHSTGYGFDLPPGIPVLAVSRNTLGYWGDRAPRNPLFFLPNALEPQWLERGDRDGRGGPRVIDVLVQQRKSSHYVLQRLVPALRARGLRVEVQDGWVDDLVDLFNSAKVYVYDSAEHWRAAGVSEGFGLPPLEAMACGCVVFSSFNSALADNMTPGESAHQIGQGLLSHDVERIAAAVANPRSWKLESSRLYALIETYGEEALLKRWIITLADLDNFFALTASTSEALLLRSRPTWWLCMQRFIRAFIRRLPIS